MFRRKHDDDRARERDRMVDEQIVARGIADPAVLAAMRGVRRHRFVPPAEARRAYDDGPLPIGRGQTISQPYVVAFMTEAARPGPEDRVLEIGTGSGYQAAVLGEIAARVDTIEIVEELARRAAEVLAAEAYANVHVTVGDGYRGHPDGARYDAILLTAAPDHVPEPLLAQLAPGGRFVLPVGEAEQRLLRIERRDDGFVEEELLPVRFVPMTGEALRG